MEVDQLEIYAKDNTMDDEAKLLGIMVTSNLTWHKKTHSAIWSQ